MRVNLTVPVRVLWRFDFQAGHGLLNASAFGHLFNQLRPRLRQIKLLLRPVQIFPRSVGFRARKNSGADEFPHIVQRLLPPKDHALGNLHELIGLFGQDVRAVEVVLQQRHVHGVLDVVLSLLQADERQRSRAYQFGDLVETFPGANDHGIVLVHSQNGLSRIDRRRRSRVRLSGGSGDKYGGERGQRGESENHSYFYSTITAGGKFLPQTDFETTSHIGTASHSSKPQPEPGWLVAVRAAQEKQATDIKVLDLTGVTSFTDYFVICSGSNTRQNQAIADEIGMQLKKRGELPNSVEGYQQGEWILSDYGDFLVHVLSQKAREYYSLERLWREAKIVTIPAE
jgi:ribosome-associated protein